MASVKEGVSDALQTRLRSALGNEPEKIKQVFSIVRNRLRLSNLAPGHHQGPVPQAWFFRSACANQEWPGLRTSPAALAGSLDAVSKKYFETMRRHATFRVALETLEELQPHFGFGDGDALRLLGFVCQTFFGSDTSFRETNEAIASNLLNAATARHKELVAASVVTKNAPPTSPVSIPSASVLLTVAGKPASWPAVVDRPDESIGGGYLHCAGICAQFASHVGPAFAQKGENQDASHVVEAGNRVFFALADGVSTSAASRFASAAATRVFCEVLTTGYSRTPSGPAPQVLLGAVQQVQDRLTAWLSYLIANPGAEEWAHVMGVTKLSMDVVVRLAENTIAPKNRFWAPMMATTFIGGSVERTSQGMAVSIVRVGDGACEIRTAGSEVVKVLSMDATETEVTQVIAPGPTGLAALAKIESCSVDLVGKDQLVIASDGLMRGHDDGLIEVLLKVCPSEFSQLQAKSSSGARDILVAAAQRADEAYRKDPDVKLFNDNVSLIAISLDAK